MTIRWNDSQSGAPYNVYNVQMRSEDFWEDLEISTGFWICVEDTISRTATVDNLVPGQDYWIVVANKDGDYVILLYSLHRMGKNARAVLFFLFLIDRNATS